MQDRERNGQRELEGELIQKHEAKDSSQETGAGRSGRHAALVST